jgi:hypothetical protein
LGGESENEKEDKPDDGGLPEELKGTNSKHLNRLIVEKQVLQITSQNILLSSALPAFVLPTCTDSFARNLRA